MISELFGFDAEFRSGGANHFEDCLQFQLEIKIWSFLFGFVFTNHFSHYFEKFIEEMAGSSQLSVKSLNLFLMKIDVVKFDSMNNFGIWKYEVMDPLTTSNLKDSLHLEEKLEKTSKKDWENMNWMVRCVIRSCLTQDIKYHVLYETFARKIWELEKKYLTKSIESRLHLKRRFYRFQLKSEFSIGDHMNNYTKLFVDLINVDVEIEEEDKAVALLYSLPDEELRHLS